MAENETHLGTQQHHYTDRPALSRYAYVSVSFQRAQISQNTSLT